MDYSSSVQQDYNSGADYSSSSNEKRGMCTANCSNCTGCRVQ